MSADNNPQTYRTEQVTRIEHGVGTGDTRAQLKLRDQNGETHWLRLSATELAVIQALISGLGPEPWCNHDPAGVHRGVCECGQVVSDRDSEGRPTTIGRAIADTLEGGRS